MNAVKPRHSLETEQRTFNEHRDALVGRARGKFVLIKGDAIVDIFDSRTDAIRRGFQEFGNVPFFVKEITAFDAPLNFTSYDIGE